MNVTRRSKTNIWTRYGIHWVILPLQNNIFKADYINMRKEDYSELDYLHYVVKLLDFVKIVKTVVF